MGCTKIPKVLHSEIILIMSHAYRILRRRINVVVWGIGLVVAIEARGQRSSHGRCAWSWGRGREVERCLCRTVPTNLFCRHKSRFYLFNCFFFCVRHRHGRRGFAFGLLNPMRMDMSMDDCGILGSMIR
jgi:hypothetical protein